MTVCQKCKDTLIKWGQIYQTVAYFGKSSCAPRLFIYMFVHKYVNFCNSTADNDNADDDDDDDVDADVGEGR